MTLPRCLPCYHVSYSFCFVEHASYCHIASVHEETGIRTQGKRKLIFTFDLEPVEQTLRGCVSRLPFYEAVLALFIDPMQQRVVSAGTDHVVNSSL